MKTILPTQSNYSLIDSDEVIEVAIHTRPLSKWVMIFIGIYLVSLFLTSVFLTVLMRSLIREQRTSWFVITLYIGVLAATGIFVIMIWILRATLQENFIISREVKQSRSNTKQSCSGNGPLSTWQNIYRVCMSHLGPYLLSGLAKLVLIMVEKLYTLGIV